MTVTLISAAAQTADTGSHTLSLVIFASLAITDTWDLDSPVMPNVSTSFSIRRVDTPSR